MARYRSVRAIAFSFIARVAGSRLKLSLLVLTCGCCMGIYVLKRANREPPPKINFVHPCVAAIGRNVTHQPGSEYVSSQLEESWLQSSLDGSAICNMSLRQWQEAGIWTGYSKSVFRPGGQPAREPTQEEASVLSLILPVCRRGVASEFHRASSRDGSAPDVSNLWCYRPFFQS